MAGASTNSDLEIIIAVMKGDLRATEGISAEDQSWPWWPLLPLYPYGRRATHFEELIPEQVWSLEQLQGELHLHCLASRGTMVPVMVIVGGVDDDPEDTIEDETKPTGLYNSFRRK